jgi:hypothetical protein
VAAHAFTVRADRVWKLPSGVRVRLDAVLRNGEMLENADGSTVVGPAALVHASRGDSAILDGWVTVGTMVELGDDLYVLRNVMNTGALNAIMMNSEYGLAPLPTRQPGRAATFGPP